MLIRLLWGFFGLMSGIYGVALGGLIGLQIRSNFDYPESGLARQIVDRTSAAPEWIIIPMMISIGLLTLAGAFSAFMRIPLKEEGESLSFRDGLRMLAALVFGLTGLLTALCIQGDEGPYLAFLLWPFMLVWAGWQMIAYASRRTQP